MIISLGFAGEVNTEKLNKSRYFGKSGDALRLNGVVTSDIKIENLRKVIFDDMDCNCIRRGREKYNGSELILCLALMQNSPEYLEKVEYLKAEEDRNKVYLDKIDNNRKLWLKNNPYFYTITHSNATGVQSFYCPLVCIRVISSIINGSELQLFGEDLEVHLNEKPVKWRVDDYLIEVNNQSQLIITDLKNNKEVDLGCFIFIHVDESVEQGIVEVRPYFKSK